MKNLNVAKAGICSAIGLIEVLLLSALFHAAGANSHAWLLLILPAGAGVAWLLYVKWPWAWPTWRPPEPPPRL